MAHVSVVVILRVKAMLAASVHGRVGVMQGKTHLTIYMARVVAAVKVGEKHVVLVVISVMWSKHVARWLHGGHLVASKGRYWRHSHVLSLDEKIAGPIVGVVRGKPIAGPVERLAAMTDQFGTVRLRGTLLGVHVVCCRGGGIAAAGVVHERIKHLSRRLLHRQRSALNTNARVLSLLEEDPSDQGD